MLRLPTRKGSEMVSAWGGTSPDWTRGLRTMMRGMRRTFWPAVPAYSGTEIDYDKARALYRNDARSTNLGSGFCRPIIDSQVEFIGLPLSTTGDEIIDDHLNDCVHNYWKAGLHEMVRNTLRDSKCVVRYRRANPLGNPLIGAAEFEAGYVEVYPPESVTLIYKTGQAEVVERAYVTHVAVEEQDGQDQLRINGDFRVPRLVEKTIIEVIDSEFYRYYDQSTGKWREDLQSVNTWGFVPLFEVYNEWDSALEGGQSEFEGPYPFIRAFHDVLGETLLAHKAHSIPKAYFKVNDVMPFIVNNFRDSFTEFDDEGNPLVDSFTGTISWKGTEIIFTGVDEDAGFMEAKSVLGDSKTLLEFIFDCICIASETPKWVFMQNEQSGVADPLKSLAWTKKIERKRNNFESAFKTVCKMALVASSLAPTSPSLTWHELSPQDEAAKAQAFNDTMSALELAAQRQLVSDRTARQRIKRYIPEMKQNDQEATDAKSNIDLLAATAAPNSVTATGGTGKNN
jgi:hypothetical protein